jgi:predicted hotdog family 3-hydroxylacyl-ACP dehydratase
MHPMSPSAETLAIESVVPHRGRMLLVDRLLAHDEDAVAVGAAIRADNLFADAQGVPAWIGIEYMAQAIAAWAGCRALARSEPVRIGFLLGARRYDGDPRHFAIGTMLRIEARRELFGDNGMGMFACRILEGDTELARAQVAVFEPPDPSAFLGGQSA